jgi:hypothetical protein
MQSKQTYTIRHFPPQIKVDGSYVIFVIILWLMILTLTLFRMKLMSIMNLIILFNDGCYGPPPMEGPPAVYAMNRLIPLLNDGCCGHHQWEGRALFGGVCKGLA